MPCAKSAVTKAGQVTIPWPFMFQKRLTLGFHIILEMIRRCLKNNVNIGKHIKKKFELYPPEIAAIDI